MPPIEDVCENILKAINCDEDYLNRELPKAQKSTNGLELEDFVNFFMHMSESQRFFKSDELLYLGENFTNDKGTVDFGLFLAKLLDVRMHKGLKRDHYA